MDLTNQVDEREVQPRDVLGIVVCVLGIAQHQRQIRWGMLLHPEAKLVNKTKELSELWHGPAPFEQSRTTTCCAVSRAEPATVKAARRQPKLAHSHLQRAYRARVLALTGW